MATPPFHLQPKDVKFLAASVGRKTSRYGWSWSSEGSLRTKWETECGRLPPPRSSTQLPRLSPRLHSAIYWLLPWTSSWSSFFSIKIPEPWSRFPGFSWSPLSTIPINTIMWLTMNLTHYYTAISQYSGNGRRTNRASNRKQGTGYSLRRGSDPSDVRVGRELRM